MTIIQDELTVSDIHVSFIEKWHENFVYAKLIKNNIHLLM